MFGLDDWIAGFSDGASLWAVVLVAVFLGLRHAADPDHLAAVTALIASGRDRAGHAAARMGLAWGIGHGTTLFVFGLPIVIFNGYLPERVQQAAETVIGFVIVYLALRLLPLASRLLPRPRARPRRRHPRPSPRSSERRAQPCAPRSVAHRGLRHRSRARHGW